MILKKNKKRESFINRIFITFMVLVSILFLFISIYFYMNYGDKEEELSILFIILFIASFIGGIVYTPVHLEFLKYKEYSLCTAISNYFLMLIESTIIFYGFSLNETNLGWYTQWFLIALYIFFGIHFFSYPKSFKESLLAIMPYVIFILLNLIREKERKISSVILLISKEGYIFSLALLISGFLMFFMPWLRLRMLKANKSVLVILGVYSLLYSIFILIPGLWFLVSGLGNYFSNASFHFNIISIIYFVYILVEKIKSLTKEFLAFITVKKEGSE